MTKVQKCLAKLYFALGESGAQIPSGSDLSASSVEYLAFQAVHGTGASLGARYFAMGAASAKRRAAKPPGGKSSCFRKQLKPSPPKGKKQAGRVIESSKSIKKAMDWDGDDDYDMEGDE
jgi:hypothetical protein